MRVKHANIYPMRVCEIPMGGMFSTPYWYDFSMVKGDFRVLIRVILNSVKV